MANKTINCPQCGREIEIKPQVGDPAKLVAYCYCGGRQLRAVYLTTAANPVYPDSSAKLDKKKES